jgi:hypothetical protein
LNNFIQYFRNPAAEITYWPAGYLRADWHSMATEPTELRAIYEHVLQAMQRYQVTALLFVHRQPEAIPPPVQEWLVANWIPRAIKQGNYQRCAIVEDSSAEAKQVTQAIGRQLDGTLTYAFFADVEMAITWLLHSAKEVLVA